MFYSIRFTASGVVSVIVSTFLFSVFAFLFYLFASRMRLSCLPSIHPLLIPLFSLAFISVVLFLALFFLPPTLPLFSLGEPIPLGYPVQTPDGVLKVPCKIPVNMISYNWYGIELGKVYVSAD